MKRHTIPSSDPESRASSHTPFGRPRWALSHISNLVGIALLIGLILQIGPSRITSSLRHCDWVFIAVSQGWYCVALLLGGARWTYLGRTLCATLSRSRMMGVYLANAFLSNLTPARAGEAAAPLLMEQRCGLTKADGAAIILFDRSVDTIVLMVATIASGVFLGMQVSKTSWSSAIVILSGCAVILAGACAIVLFKPMKRWVFGWVERTYAQERPAGRVEAIMRILKSLSVPIFRMISGRHISVVLGMTLLSWATQFLRTYFLFNAFTPVPLSDTIVLHSIGMAIAIVSLVPSGIGIVTISYVTLARLLGLDWTPIAGAHISGMILAHITRFLFSIGASSL